MESKKKAVTIAGIMAVVVALLLIQLGVIRTVEKHRVGTLLVASPAARGARDWTKVNDSETELSFALSTENGTFVIRESIVARHQKDVGGIPGEDTSKHLSQGKAKVAAVVGFMLERFLQEGFEVGQTSSFVEIAGASAYRFELIKRKVPTEYMTHILIWKEDWYVITYASNTASPGPHISDFNALLDELEFT